MNGSRGGGMGSTAGPATATAKRVLTTFLETSGLVCGSLKDTVQDKLNENDMDMKWVEDEIDNIKTKLEKPRERMLDLTDKACQMGGRGGAGADAPLSPVEAFPPNFGDDHTLDGNGTITTAEGRTLTISTGDMDDEHTMTSTLMPPAMDSPPRKKRDRVPSADASAASQAQHSAAGGHTVFIGLCLSRKNSTLGHPDTVTRQTAFDFNELQDRDYKYVSSTDDSGWLAGGGERGDPYLSGVPREFVDARAAGGGGVSCVPSAISSKSEESCSAGDNNRANKSFGAGHKIAASDRVHIPIIQINVPHADMVDEIVSALARGEIFIPEVSILPETLGVSSASPPDLQVRFGCEKNDDTNPEDWPNWCLEFLHNQLYDYFAPVGAQWSKRPFQITLARKVRWMTVKHMNKYFARSESVINSWREKGPQYLQPPYSDDSSRGVILEEITRPHGIYLIQNGAPTNYFAPNFQPPYTTKMRRSLIRNVIGKSWDAKHRDWLSMPLPKIRGPAQYLSSVMGCNNPAGQLSPVEEARASDLSSFHMREDFDFMGENNNADIGGRTATQETEGTWNRQSERKPTHNEVQQNDKPQKSPERLARHDHERQNGPDPTPMPSIPSDESYGDSLTRPSETLSMEETMTDTINEDSVGAPPTYSQSESVESPQRSKDQWSIDEQLSPGKASEDDADNSGREDRSPSFGSSSKGVSFSDTSLAESERRADREHQQLQQQQQQWRQEHSTNGLEHKPEKETQHKVDDRRGLDSKFAKTKSKRREMRDRRQDENGERSLDPSLKTSPSQSKRGNQGPGSPSCDSMAYSLDSASVHFRPQMASSSASVANNNDTGSVMTMGTMATENQSLLSYVTRSTMVYSRYQESEEETKKFQPNIEEGDVDDISLSLLESKSSILPSDEELNSVGWAKALDPNSGSYYYFTLDRTKTVWENPLAMSP